MPFEITQYQPYDFANRRHIGPSPIEMAEMLKVVEVETLDELIDETVPASIRQEGVLDIGRGMTERDVLHHMKAVIGQNKVLTSLIGQGYHGTMIPEIWRGHQRGGEGFLIALNRLSEAYFKVIEE